MRLFAPAAILSVLFASPAATDVTSEALSQAIVDAIGWENETPDLAERRKFAQAILAYWTDFERRVPKLSPRESEWIEEALNATGERFERAVKSKEFALRWLNHHTNMCIENINDVLGAQMHENLREYEMLYWLQMLNCYDGSRDVEINLDKADISHGGRGEISLPFGYTIHHFIMNRVALMAMADAMGWTVQADE